MPKFLDKITTTHRLVRRTKKKLSDKGFSYVFKVWEKKEIEPTEVFVLGERTLSNGKRDWQPEYIAYYPEEYINALLVIKDDKTNPFYILLNEEQKRSK
jgi:hypothetical protein